MLDISVMVGWCNLLNLTSMSCPDVTPDCHVFARVDALHNQTCLIYTVMGVCTTVLGLILK